MYQYNRTKDERKAWWASLSEEEKAKRMRVYEHKRDTPDKPPLDVKPLTKKQMKTINAHMRKLGLEDQIVLPE